ncbi:MAG: hypothetical protein R6V57_18810 [Vicinamibacterales bacterium]
MSTPKKSTSTAQPPGSPVLVVPKAWLVTLAVLIVMPWLIAGAAYWWPGSQSTAPASEEKRTQPAEAAKPGPWGRLDVTTLVISPPLELVGNEWGRPDGAGKDWYFPETSSAAAEAFLASAGLSPGQLSVLMATARRDPGINGLVVTPGADLLRALPPEVRARLYVQLAGSALNVNQVHAFRFAGASAEDWLGRSLISPETRRIVEPLFYRRGGHLYFADTELVRQQIADPEELRRLAKTLLRQKTSRVRLAVPSMLDVPGLVEYWGRGGRRTDIRPLLESISAAESDGTVDIVHLLPAFARDRLYRYPLLTALDLNRPALANCLWTALNFFSVVPDDRYLDVQAAIDHLQRDYYLVENGLELGDVIVLLDERGVIYHAVVHLADNLVFTKNGTSPMAPWVILPLDAVVDYYRLRSENPRLLHHRRKDR